MWHFSTSQFRLISIFHRAYTSNSYRTRDKKKIDSPINSDLSHIFFFVWRHFIFSFQRCAFLMWSEIFWFCVRHFLFFFQFLSCQEKMFNTFPLHASINAKTSNKMALPHAYCKYHDTEYIFLSNLKWIFNILRAFLWLHQPHV